MAWSPLTLGLFSLCLIVLFAHPAHAFGAGNIASLSKIEGQNWRHGDIEDVLLTLLMSRAAGGKKFSKLDVLRVYFGNWLRDYSQAVDVGTVKYVSPEAIRILLWVLGFMTFGYATKEFEVTTARLGCYQPTEHIDNPKGYGDGEDPKQYDRRLRGPVDERRELAIDEKTGLKVYIASEDAGIATSAAFVRRVLGRSIQFGRKYAKSNNKEDLYEALRLLGTGLHCLEDYSAHSNYTELSLMELGERDVFPHVGRQTQIRLPGAREPTYPIVTGTFGGVDFLHSVMGEVSDKTYQSEIQSLEGAIEESGNDTPNSQSYLKDLLNKIPSGVFGGDNQSEKIDELESKSKNEKKKNKNVSPRKPEEWTKYLDEVQEQIRPILEWHDGLLQLISEAVEKIPVIPDLIEKVQDQITLFCFSILAPYVLPILTQVKTELGTGSSEVIQSSKDQQHVVFEDDKCTDPTHSMLSKDHFSNVLNEPGGKVAQAAVKWAVPQLMKCWDDEGADVDRTLTRIINGVFHHPALREKGEDGSMECHKVMFRVVEEWWSGKDERERGALRKQLSRDGVLKGLNHKSGVHDSGHGCGKPISLPKASSAAPTGASSVLSGLSKVLGDDSSSDKAKESFDSGGLGKLAGEASGGGGLVGGLVSGFAGGAGADFLEGSFGGSDDKKKDPKKDNKDHKDHKEHKEHKKETGHSGDRDRYGQSQHSHGSDYGRDRGGGQSQQYQQSGYGSGQSGGARYDTRGGTYGQGQGTYGQGQSTYGQGQSTYGQGQSTYGQGQSTYGQGQSTYGQGQGTYGGGHTGYGGQETYGRGSSGQAGYGGASYGGGNVSGTRQGYGNETYGGGHGSSGYGQSRRQPEQRREERHYGGSHRMDDRRHGSDSEKEGRHEDKYKKHHNKDKKHDGDDDKRRHHRPHSPRRH